MKKLLLIATLVVAMLLSGCTRTVYVEKEPDENSSSTNSKNHYDEYDEYDKNATKGKDSTAEDTATGSEESNLETAETPDAPEKPDEEAAPLADGEYKLASPLVLTLPNIGSFKIITYTISARRSEKVITLNGEYTNLDTDYDWSLGNLRGRFNAYQDDIKLNTTGHDNDVDLYTNIKTNKTIKASCSYVLRTETDDIEIIGTDYNNVEYVVTFPIK